MNMIENPQKLTVEQQLLVSEIAEELSETTSIHQQAILRMLAVASEHNLNAANLLQDLGTEMKSATARQIPFVVDDLSSGLPAVESLARTPGIVPESAVIALEIARSQGLQKPLNQALLNTTNRRKSEITGTEDLAAIDRVTNLLFKYFFLFNIFAFMMLFILPQFKMMFEEFGIELPFSMQLLVEINNYATNFWFLFPLVLLAVGIYVVIKHPRVFTSYFTRWIPGRWGQPVLTKRVRKELSLAWVVQTSDDLPETAKQFINDNGVGTEELERLAAAEKTDVGTGVLKALTDMRVLPKRASAVASMASSPESAAWILRKMSKQSHSTRRQRGLNGLRVLMWIGNFIAMALAGLAAIAIFQSLLTIIQGLTGYA